MLHSVFLLLFFLSSSSPHLLSTPSLQSSFRSLLSSFSASSLHISSLSLESPYVTITGITIEKIKLSPEKAFITYDPHLQPPSLILFFQADEAELTVNLKFYPDIPIKVRNFKLEMLLTLLPNPKESRSQWITMELEHIELNLNYVLQKVLPKIDINYANKELRKIQIPVNNEINKMIKKDYGRFFSFFKNEEYLPLEFSDIINLIGEPVTFDLDSKKVVVDGEWITNKITKKKEEL